MSVSGKEISSDVEDEADEEVVAEETQNKRRDDKDDDFGHGSSGSFGKAKRVVLYPFTKAKGKVFGTNNVKKLSSSSSSSAVRPSTAIVRKKASGKGCYSCFRQPETLESSAESQTSDPNDPKFTYDMLRVLLEKNDFYSKECNPHLDFEDTASSGCRHRD